MRPITPQNFDFLFGGMLRDKSAKNIVRARFHLDDLDFDQRHRYAVEHVMSFGLAKYALFRISYWESDEVVQEIVGMFDESCEIYHAVKYQGDENPGVLYVGCDQLDASILTTLIVHHYNYEMAEEPSMNIRIQLYLMLDSRAYLIDFYDDRGFDQFDLGANENQQFTPQSALN